MINDLKPYAVFAETVAAGSMSAAARRLGMSTSAVSQSIRALELQTGVTLLHRSTRKLSLTEAGERCYPHCLRLLQAASAAADALAQARDAPTGELRVAAPVGFVTHLAPALAPVLSQWPQLRLQLLVDDSMIDLIDARIDIAIRVGRLADSNWIARKLCDLEMILCAAPAYLERHGWPESPADLARHAWLALARETEGLPRSDSSEPAIALQLRGQPGTAESVAVKVRIASNNQLALQRLCEQGLGCARLAHADVKTALATGELVRLLPQWRFPQVAVSALTAQREGEPAKVRVAIESLQRYFSALPGIGQ
ncbi:LysR family transcriptional regulator [Pseudomonas sp. LRF_L74]|uniref:LysR family transcriptional regulator n=1 Tax=Pseudomonas sp. LRF_L74 TaxID=3369422 RepID=UPI003F5FBC41